MKIQPKSEFTRNVLTLMTGTTIAQAIPIAISPILTRIYTPEDFGAFALYMSLVSIIAVLATGRYEQAIILPKKDEDAISLVILSIIISMSMSLLTLLIVFFFNTKITELLNNQSISNWLYLIPLSVLFTGLYQSLNYWNNRKKHYSRLAVSRVIQSSSSSTTNLLLGFAKFGTSGLILGGIIGQFVAITVLAKTTVKENCTLFEKISKIKIIALGRKYINYPKKSAIGAFFNALSYQAEYILFSMFYLMHNVGIYYFVNKILNIPKQFLSNSIWQSFLSHSQENKEYILRSLSFKQEKLIRFSILPALSSLFILPDLFIFIFGSNWSGAVEYIPPLVIAMHINFVVASFSLFVIINRPDMEMKFNVFLALLKVSGIYLSYIIFDDMLISIYVISIIQVLMFVWLGNWNYKQLGREGFSFSYLYGKYVLYITFPFIILFVLSLKEVFVLNLSAYILINLIFFKWMKR